MNLNNEYNYVIKFIKNNIMRIVLNIIIFLIILFFYIHINYQLTTSNDLEIYDITDEEISRERLEELCELKQPIVFNYTNDRYREELNIKELADTYGEFELNIKDVPVKLREAIKLFENDVSGEYITEKNQDFLDETTKSKSIQMEDSIFRPPMLSNSVYDIIMGSKDSVLDYRYEISERNIFIVNSGTVEIKLATPDSKRYKLEGEHQKLLSGPDEGKIKYMTVLLKCGEAISIPNRWIYGIRLRESGTIIIKKNYESIMNRISNLDKRMKEWLQAKNEKLEYSRKREKGNFKSD